MTITAGQVKELRDRTGAGMMDCKTALGETKGNIEQAIDWLRKKGITKAEKKSGRIAADGLIGISHEVKSGAVVEVNSETDFVARNDKFQDMVRTISKLAEKAHGDLAKLLAMPYPGTKLTVEAHLKEMVATIGENMSVRRTKTLAVKQGIVSAYMHSQVAPGLGKIGVLVALDSSGKHEELAHFGRQLAMHIAATNPIAVDLAGVPADVIDREKAILADKNKGKPAPVLEKIFQSALKSFAKDNCLLDQAYVHDGGKSVAQALKETEAKVGAPIKIEGFVRYALGEGIEKKEEDFAAEVAAAVKGS